MRSHDAMNGFALLVIGALLVYVVVKLSKLLWFLP